MMSRMLCTYATGFDSVSRISELVKHTVQQLASLYIPEGYVIVVYYCSKSEKREMNMPMVYLECGWRVTFLEC